MKRFIGFLVLMLVLGIVSLGWGANTTTYDDGTITITGLDADWVFATEIAALRTAGSEYPKEFDNTGHVTIESIIFIPGAADDRMVIHSSEGIDGSPIFDTGKVADAYDARIQYYPMGRRAKPTIDITDCTLAAGTLANCVVKINLKEIKAP
jgi:hypothetical protein